MTNKKDIKPEIGGLISNYQYKDWDSEITEAGQIISEIEKIDSKEAYLRVKDRIEQKPKLVYLKRIFRNVAAVLAIPLLIVSCWLFYLRLHPGEKAEFAMQEISSPQGVRSKVALPDGSTVWLNAESTIKFNIPFSQNYRDVYLSGEAFFDVVKNPDQPFVVRAGKVKVKVLGTRFNCKSFEDDKTTEIVLESGKVELSSDFKGSKTEIMLPGDRAVINNASGETLVVNQKIDKYIAWHKGLLVFDNTPLDEVAGMLERWYGVDVVIQDQKIMNYRFTTTFENESLFDVIELLNLSCPIRLKYEPAKIGTGGRDLQKAKVIITQK